MSQERQRALDRERKRCDRAAHPDKYRAIDHAKYVRRRATHPDRENARSMRWYYANPWRTVWLIWRNNRIRARRIGMDAGATTVQDIARLVLLPCTFCGVTPANGVDHRTPFARGGSNAVANLSPCCLSCNRRKFTNEAPR